MRYAEIMMEETISLNVDAKKMAKAEADGFDTSKLWYHGTRRKFTNFRAPKAGGINELGLGVYVTKFVGTANVWAQGNGTILACVLRKGKLIELSELSKAQLWFSGPEQDDKWSNTNWREVYRGYCIFTQREHGADAVLSYNNFAESFNRREISLSKCLSEIGYIGATNRYSQIKGQAVIWDHTNIRTVGKAAGVHGYVHTTPYDQEHEED